MSSPFKECQSDGIYTCSFCMYHGTINCPPKTPEPPRMNGETTVASGNASGLTLDAVRRAARGEAERLAPKRHPF